MIVPKGLLNDLKRILKALEDDIRERCESVPEIGAGLQDEYSTARAAERTAEAFSVWRDETITQSAAAWILGCVFVRFLEDNGLIDTAWIAGQGDRLRQARDQHTLYFQTHPKESDREYLEHVFREVATLPTVAELFAPAHNPLWRLEPSGDGARLLLEFFQKITPATGDLVHDFTDPHWNTRFLGDLYQDLSQDARDKYALLQTPEFVEEFILDRTLTPAIATFGLKEVRLIDPTCGSGHFALGAFHRLLRQWQEIEPGTNVRALVQRVLDAIYGVDLNPFAVAIARFRLLVEALRACGIRTLRNAPAFRFNLAVGDSLLHGRLRQQYVPGFEAMDEMAHVYATEDAAELRRILEPGRYHVVVGNPPYITVKDRAVGEAYRKRYGSCHRQYSLAVPFMERFFNLAVAAGIPSTPDSQPFAPAGFVGMITANSFMKREFGKKLVETYMPCWDLTHVIDTSGAYIPGHGTPTVVLFGRNQRPVSDAIRAVMGIRGEPGTPDDPARGEVWSAILDQVDRHGSESAYVSVADTQRAQFHKHPWSIGGGGAAELKRQLGEASSTSLNCRIDTVCSVCYTRLDEVYLVARDVLGRARVPSGQQVDMVSGEGVRDWTVQALAASVFPVNTDLAPVAALDAPALLMFLWPYREDLWRRKELGGDHRELKRTWWEWNRFLSHRFRNPLSIGYAEISTHNNFAFDRGGRVFTQTAPVIKLPVGSTADDHARLLGLLNSSTACFWLKQVCFPKGGAGIGRGIQDEAWESRFAFDGTKLRQFPLPDGAPLTLATELDRLGQELSRTLPSALVRRATPTKAALADSTQRITEIRERMIALQEELDWQCYSLYGITDETFWTEHLDRIPSIKLGERAFEIVLARKMAAGEEETTWFARHGSTPITEIPAHWPDEYRRVVQHRIKLIESDRNIGLIERPEYKRRWAMDPWEKQVEAALREWLLNRMEFALSGRDLMKEANDKADAAREDAQERMVKEALADAARMGVRPEGLEEPVRGLLEIFGGAENRPRAPLRDPELLSCARLADRLRMDVEFQQVAELYTGRPDFDLTRLVTDLVGSDGVPYLPTFRYKPSGLRKRQEWELVWELQRREDDLAQRRRSAEEEGDKERAKELQGQTDAVNIPVPPKYASADFQSSTYWRLRGKLDVPKERFILYSGCGQDGDPTPVLTWAGWNHLQQARALAEYYRSMQGQGWTVARLLPLLAGLADLLPWLKQWHNDLDPEFSLRMGDYFTAFVQEEARSMGKTVGEVRSLGSDGAQ